MRVADHAGWEPVNDTVLVMDFPSGEVVRLIGVAATGWLAVTEGRTPTAEELEAIAPLVDAGLLEPDGAAPDQADQAAPDSAGPESQ